MNPLKRAHEEPLTGEPLEALVDGDGCSILFFYSLAYLIEPLTLDRCYSGFVPDHLHNDDDLSDAFTRPVGQEDKRRIMHNPKYLEFYKQADTSYIRDKSRVAMLVYLGTRDPTFIRRLRGYQDCLFDPLDMTVCAKYNDADLKHELESVMVDIVHTKKVFEKQVAELDKVIRAMASIPSSSAEFTLEMRKDVAAACRACIENIESEETEDLFDYLRDFAKYIY